MNNEDILDGIIETALCVRASDIHIDPTLPTAHFESVSIYDSGYTIIQDSSGHITLEAMSEMDPGVPITITR